MWDKIKEKVAVSVVVSLYEVILLFGLITLFFVIGLVCGYIMLLANIDTLYEFIMTFSSTLTFPGI